MRVRHGVLLLLVALTAAACGGGNGDPDGGGGSATTPARQELTVGITDDQYIVSGDRANVGNGLNILETLALLTPDYQVRPLLAERWEFRAPNTWRFVLRRGVTFHDGQPLTAQAVKTGLFDRVAKTPGGGTLRAGPNSAVVVDDHTIDFTPTGPNLRVPEQIVHPNTGVAAPGADMGTKPIGTGPFRFVEYRAKERLVVERNPDYWGTKPALERITFRFYPDDSTRRLALEAGELDLIVNVPTPDVRAVKDKGLVVAASPVGAYDAMYLNIHGSAPHDLLADIRLRQAVAAAIDRKAIATGVLDGQATADPTMVPPSSLGPYASMVKGVNYDPARSRTLLDTAGWRPGSDGIREKDGRRLHLQLISGFPSAATLRPLPTYVQSQLKQVGIDLEVVERADSASYQEVLTAGRGDIFMEQGSQNDGNPSLLPVLLFYSGGSGATADYVGRFGPGARFDELIGPTLTEVDLDKVRRATAAAMQYIIDDQAVVVPLAGISRIYAMKKSVQGFTPHPSLINVRWDGVSVR